MIIGEVTLRLTHIASVLELHAVVALETILSQTDRSVQGVFVQVGCIVEGWVQSQCMMVGGVAVP